MDTSELTKYTNQYIGIVNNLAVKLQAEAADKAWADAYFSAVLLERLSEAIKRLATHLAEDEAASLVLSDSLAEEIEQALRSNDLS